MPYPCISDSPHKVSHTGVVVLLSHHLALLKGKISEEHTGLDGKKSTILPQRTRHSANTDPTAKAEIIDPTPAPTSPPTNAEITAMTTILRM